MANQANPGLRLVSLLVFTDVIAAILALVHCVYFAVGCCADFGRGLAHNTDQAP